MCGIFGAIGTRKRKPDMGILRALTMANRQRGKESLGFFNTAGEVFKVGKDPIDVLASEECQAYFERTTKSAWGIVGHTRYSTRGKVCDRNSHPFEYGNFVGSHNGIVDAPNQYEVDSEYLIDLLNTFDGDYQSALATEWGYWTLAYLDKARGHLVVTMHDNTCGICEYKGVYYFSSDADHLMVALGAREVTLFNDGDTCRFTKAGFDGWIEPFVSSVGMSYKKNWKTSGGYSSSSSYSSTGAWNGDGYDYGSYGSNSGTGSTYSAKSKGWPDGEDQVKINDPDNFIRDYDDEFRQIWNEYVHQYEPVE